MRAWMLIALVAIGGTAGPDQLSGTHRDEKIRGLAGDDRLSGKGGDDVLIGGPGADALRGGSGEDRCLTDADDPAPRGCEDVVGPAGPLTVTKVTGTDRCIVLRRAEGCYFVIEGTGADSESGSVAGAGGVRVLAPGGEVGASDGRWTANGTYACDADGSLDVTIAAEAAAAPVDCPG
jgi:hypothetical protein